MTSKEDTEPLCVTLKAGIALYLEGKCFSPGPAYSVLPAHSKLRSVPEPPPVASGFLSTNDLEMTLHLYFSRGSVLELSIGFCTV